MMNKQEAIDEIENAIPDFILNDYQRGKETGLTYALELVKQLDEPVKPPEPAPWQPEKPVVPRFVADWLEVCKDNLALSLANSMNNIVMRTNNQPDKTIHWLSKNSETFAKAWLYGYEVEKEKLYTVELPNPNGDGYSKLYLSKNKDGKVELFQWSDYTSTDFADDWKLLKNAQLTEDEIKEDFAWAW
ncbi:DUF1642 domain-containing protein [Streptococcus pasteurianus]